MQFKLLLFKGQLYIETTQAYSKFSKITFPLVDVAMVAPTVFHVYNKVA